jgi:signal transduction histidine kinase
MFAVQDDGAGFDPATNATGSGLTNMRARIEAVNGSLVTRSSPTAGTRIEGRIPGAGAA